MRKDFGVKTWLYPMPVFIVAAYDENGVPCCMNAAWGGIYDTNQVMVCLADESVLGEDGQIAPEKLEAITYDSVRHTYIKLGEKVGNAFSDGNKLK